MKIEDLQIGSITFRDGPINWRKESGRLYVIEFDSGWIKVGLSTDFDARLSALTKEYWSYHGWEVVRFWTSDLVPTLGVDPDSPDGCNTPLDHAERDLLKQASHISDGSELNPFVRGRGRDPQMPRATELFRGCRFEYLCAYGEVLTRTAAKLREALSSLERP